MSPEPETARCARHGSWERRSGAAPTTRPIVSSKGVWEHGFRDRWIEEVKSIHVGDRIAIKSTYTKKYGLPFDNHMRIHADRALETLRKTINP